MLVDVFPQFDFVCNFMFLMVIGSTFDLNFVMVI